MLDTLFIAILIFLELLFYIVFIDVVLSWLILFGLRYRPKFISDIIDPIYKFIRSIIPTSFGPLDFTPIILIIIIYFIRGLVIYLNPSMQDFINSMIK